MKKLLLVLLISILLPVFAHAAVGTVTLASYRAAIDGVVVRKIITVSWTAGTGAEAGTIPSTTIATATYGLTGWYLYSVETNPGTTAPDDNYDLVINDADGVDIAGGLLVNRDSTATELVNTGTGPYGYSVIRGDLTIVMSGNSVESSTGTIIITFTKE